jgi:Tfp pilus assembly major pilin PilA
MSQMTTESSIEGSDAAHTHCLTLSMQKNQRYALKLQHHQQERQIDLECEKMQYENANVQTIHMRLMENKQMEIQLEEARACAATEAAKAKQQDIELLHLQPKMKGMDPNM